MKSSPLTIGQVADRFGLPTHVLRHWESVGLLSPARVEGDRRRYSDDDVVRVASIVLAKQAGMSLPDIREFLTSIHTTARKDVLRRSRRALQTKMAAMQAALDFLDGGLNCSHEDITTCPNYRAHIAKLVDLPDRSVRQRIATAKQQDPQREQPSRRTNRTDRPATPTADHQRHRLKAAAPTT